MDSKRTLRVLVRGGGDLASGVVVRLHRAGWNVLVVELAEPRAVRRLVSFAQAVYDGAVQVEDVVARRVSDEKQMKDVMKEGLVPVLVDPELDALNTFRPDVIVDGRMRKRPPETNMNSAALVIGLGPGFIAGEDCHAVIETNRGPFLGRVIWQGQAQADTGVPERVGEYRAERVLRAPADGILTAAAAIGESLRPGQIVARVDGNPILAPFAGVLRGLMMDGIQVTAGEKIGDVDPRGDPQLCWLVSDKSLSIGGGVLEAILSWKPFRGRYFVKGI